MYNARRTPRRMALAVWWVVSTVWLLSTVTPAAPQTVTDGACRREETSQMMSLICPAQYHPVCVVHPLEASVSMGQPSSQIGTGFQAWSDETASVELEVPEALVRALLREQQRTGSTIELQVPRALPMILATEDWE